MQSLQKGKYLSGDVRHKQLSIKSAELYGCKITYTLTGLQRNFRV